MKTLHQDSGTVLRNKRNEVAEGGRKRLPSRMDATPSWSDERWS